MNTKNNTHNNSAATNHKLHMIAHVISTRHQNLVHRPLPVKYLWRPITNDTPALGPVLSARLKNSSAALRHKLHAVTIPKCCHLPQMHNSHEVRPYFQYSAAVHQQCKRCTLAMQTHADTSTLRTCAVLRKEQYWKARTIYHGGCLTYKTDR